MSDFWIIVSAVVTLLVFGFTAVRFWRLQKR